MGRYTLLLNMHSSQTSFAFSAPWDETNYGCCYKFVHQSIYLKTPFFLCLAVVPMNGRSILDS